MTHVVCHLHVEAFALAIVLTEEEGESAGCFLAHNFGTNYGYQKFVGHQLIEQFTCT